MKNKTELLSILLFSVLLTSFGIYMDDDKNNLNALNSTKEFIMMLFFVFTVISGIYFSIKFAVKKAKQLLA